MVLYNLSLKIFILFRYLFRHCGAKVFKVFKDFNDLKVLKKSFLSVAALLFAEAHHTLGEASVVEKVFFQPLQLPE